MRTITGFDKALAISFQRVNGGLLVKVGAQTWVDQIAIGAVGLAIHPLLITAAVEPSSKIRPYTMCSIRLTNTSGTNSRKPRSGNLRHPWCREMTGSSS
ncbi:hypothetical protein [Ktedonobacter racemifer]|uniref:hypothetical protein n=1 Tax=Ktedonobacter racemifer TaxID=363277 RepID=UPI0012FB8047|nr:hypothetical protein [Ktedonobacter racemifer]